MVVLGWALRPGWKRVLSTGVQGVYGNKADFRHTIAMFFQGFLYPREQDPKIMSPDVIATSARGTRSPEEIVRDSETVNFLLRRAEPHRRRPTLGQFADAGRQTPPGSIR